MALMPHLSTRLHPSSPRLSVAVRTSVTSAKQWIARQSSDPYVKAAARENMRSRASFKLEQMQKGYELIRRNDVVLDLGASPGGWTQVAARHVRKGRVVAIDLLPIDPIPGAVILQGDMVDPSVQSRVIDALGGKGANVVLSDMAHSFTGNRGADVARVQTLCEVALEVAERVLRPGGNFVCKFIQGEGSDELRNKLIGRFARVIYDKPPASRSDSAEGYMICLNHAPPSLTSPQPLVSEFRNRPQSTDAVIPPHWKEIVPGSFILAALPGGRGLVKARVETVLSRDFHAKGVKVRLVDGRLARATALIGEDHD
ncbi:hypothetical protein HDU67_002534 [Dinochytrium kinnereticum]|nr:hypothetical protein HDU67_002534 [Dinochytrium kinnereticum]